MQRSDDVPQCFDVVYRGAHTCGVDRKVSAAVDAAPAISPADNRQIILNFGSGHLVKNKESDGEDIGKQIVNVVEPDVPVMDMVNGQYFDDEFVVDFVAEDFPNI